MARLETMLAELVSLQNRAHSLQIELLAKLDSLADSLTVRLIHVPPSLPGQALVSEASASAPDEEFLALPVVVLNERGEYLGLTPRHNRAFSLREFRDFLHQRTAGLGRFEALWSRENGDWVLTLLGQEAANGQSHSHYFSRIRTARGNLVAHFKRLDINGHTVSEAFLQAFLRQIKDSLEQPARQERGY